MIRRLKLFWKLALIAALIPLSVGAGMAVALHGARQLEAEYDHLYRLMRIPLVALDEANTRRDALEGELQELARPDLSPERRVLLVQRIRQGDRAMATLVRYRKEWLTTLSADFPAEYGRLESNTRAQAVIGRMISQLLLMGLLLSLAGILAAWGLSRMIGRPLERLIRITSRLSRGELETLKGEDGARPDPHARDEVGTLLRTTWDLVGSTERMAVAASAIAQGDLTVRIEPRSEKDVLGNALSHLSTRLKELMSGMRASAQMLVEATSKASSMATRAASDADESAMHIYDMLPGIVSRMDERLTETAERCRQLSEWMLQGAQDAESSSQEAFLMVTGMKDIVTALLEELSKHSQKATQGAGEVVASRVELVRQFLGEQVSFIHRTTALVRQVEAICRQEAIAMSELHMGMRILANKADRARETSRLLEEAMAQLVLGAQELQGLAGPFHLEQGQEPS